MPPRKQEGREGAVVPRSHRTEGTLDMELGPDEDREEEAGNPGSGFQRSSIQATGSTRGSNMKLTDKCHQASGLHRCASLAWLGSALSSMQGQMGSGIPKTPGIFNHTPGTLRGVFASHSTGHELHVKRMSLQDSSCAKLEPFRKCCREGPV